MIAVLVALATLHFALVDKYRIKDMEGGIIVSCSICLCTLNQIQVNPKCLPTSITTDC